MKTVVLRNNKLVLKLYDSIDELPVVNYQKFNKYLLLDSGVGSGVGAIDNHIIRAAEYVNAKDTNSALRILESMHQAMLMTINEVSPEMMAFATLVYSINGKPVTDYSDEGLREIHKLLNETRRSKFVEIFVELKKKINEELSLYFPDDFKNPKEKEAYDQLKRKVSLQIDEVLNGKDNTALIDRINSLILGLYKPSTFQGTESAEIKHDKQFESACTIIGQKTNLNAKNMTTLQFYSALEDIRKQAEAEAKVYKRNKK